MNLDDRKIDFVLGSVRAEESVGRKRRRKTGAKPEGGAPPRAETPAETAPRPSGRRRKRR